MKIQEFTRRLIIDELLMHGCVCGQMRVSEFVQRVFPRAMEMPTTDRRFGMKTAVDDIRQHMDNNDDWDFEYLFCTYLDLLHVEDKELQAMMYIVSEGRNYMMPLLVKLK